VVRVPAASQASVAAGGEVLWDAACAGLSRHPQGAALMPSPAPDIGRTWAPAALIAASFVGDLWRKVVGPAGEETAQRAAAAPLRP
jgi:hypothetical protein